MADYQKGEDIFSKLQNPSISSNQKLEIIVEMMEEQNYDEVLSNDFVNQIDSVKSQSSQPSIQRIAIPNSKFQLPDPNESQSELDGSLVERLRKAIMANEILKTASKASALQKMLNLAGLDAADSLPQLQDAIPQAPSGQQTPQEESVSPAISEGETSDSSDAQDFSDFDVDDYEEASSDTDNPHGAETSEVPENDSFGGEDDEGVVNSDENDEEPDSDNGDDEEADSDNEDEDEGSDDDKKPQKEDEDEGGEDEKEKETIPPVAASNASEDKPTEQGGAWESSNEKPDEQKEGHDEKESEKDSEEKGKDKGEKSKNPLKKMAKSIQGAFVGLFGFLFNPVVWAAILIIIIAAFITGITKSWGPVHVDNYCGVDEAPLFVAGWTSLEKRDAIMSHLVDSGLGQNFSGALTYYIQIKTWCETDFISLSIDEELDHTTNEGIRKIIEDREGNVSAGLLPFSNDLLTELVNYAESKSSEWTRSDIQLAFIIKKIEEKYNLSRGSFKNLMKESFGIVLTATEEADLLREGKKIGNEHVESSTGCRPIGLGRSFSWTSIHVGDAIAIAFDIATLSNRVVYTNGGFGADLASPEYIAAKAYANSVNKYGPDNSGLYASCDRTVATIVLVSGMDDYFPWGHVGTQKAYLDGSPRWTEVSCEDRQPGDIIIQTKPSAKTGVVSPGHIMFYVGNSLDPLTGKSGEQLIEGSYMKYLPKRSAFPGCNTGRMATTSNISFNWYRRNSIP